VWAKRTTGNVFPVSSFTSRLKFEIVKRMSLLLKMTMRSMCMYYVCKFVLMHIDRFVSKNALTLNALIYAFIHRCIVTKFVLKYLE